MSEELARTLLPAMEIAGFRRTPDGAFVQVAECPPWFGRLVADTTFPFLGHILEEAVDFWGSGTHGRRDWGPCEEVDEAGRKFHYKVTALATIDGDFLLFQLDPESDHTRDMLKIVRAKALAAEYQSSAEATTLRAVQREVQRATTEIGHLLDLFLAMPSGEAGTALARALGEKCARLSENVETLVSSAAPKA